MSSKLLLVIVTVFTASPAFACLRDQMDERAVQWSSLVVQAKLVSVGDRTNLADGQWYRVFTINVEQVLDGDAKQGDQLQVVRFFSANGDTADSCADKLASSQVDKSFVLMLRPAWQSVTPASDLPKNALVIVHDELISKLDADQLQAIKSTIKQTRDAEKAFKEDQARAQAETVANSADETEEQDAEKALREMGYKAIGSIRTVMEKKPESKAKLSAVLKDLEPPPVPASKE